MSDASLVVDDRRLAIIRSLDPRTRLRQALEASDLARRLAFIRLREVYPELTQRELVARWLSDAFPNLELRPPFR